MTDPVTIYVISDREYSDGGDLVAFMSRELAEEYAEAAGHKLDSDQYRGWHVEELQLWSTVPAVILCRFCKEPIEKLQKDTTYGHKKGTWTVIGSEWDNQCPKNDYKSHRPLKDTDSEVGTYTVSPKP